MSANYSDLLFQLIDTDSKIYFSSIADFAHKDKKEEWNRPFSNVVVKKYLSPVDRLVDFFPYLLLCIVFQTDLSVLTLEKWYVRAFLKL